MSKDICSAKIEGGYYCTEERGHEGPHVARRSGGEVVAKWKRPTVDQAKAMHVILHSGQKASG